MTNSIEKSEIAEHTTVDEWNNDEYVRMGLVAKMHHHTENGEGESNKHAIVVGDEVIVLEKEIE